MWHQYNKETHLKDPNNVITPNNYINTVNEYYRNHTLNILKRDKFLMTIPHKQRLVKTKDQLIFWTK